MRQTKKDKAKGLRYKKAILATLSYEHIVDSLSEMSVVCEDVHWFVDDEETLLDALDGDSDDIAEFRLAFGGLCANCESLSGSMRDNLVQEHFDDFLVGLLGNRYKIIGFDSYEEDYYGLTSYESELAESAAGKRIMAMTKADIVATAGQALGVVISFLDVVQHYDYLKAVFDILRDENSAVLKNVRAIEQLFVGAEAEGFCGSKTSTLDRLAWTLPDDVWVA